MNIRDRHSVMHVSLTVTWSRDRVTSNYSDAFPALPQVLRKMAGQVGWITHKYRRGLTKYSGHCNGDISINGANTRTCWLNFVSYISKCHLCIFKPLRSEPDMQQKKYHRVRASTAPKLTSVQPVYSESRRRETDRVVFAWSCRGQIPRGTAQHAVVRVVVSSHVCVTFFGIFMFLAVCMSSFSFSFFFKKQQHFLRSFCVSVCLGFVPNMSTRHLRTLPPPPPPPPPSTHTHTHTNREEEACDFCPVWLESCASFAAENCCIRCLPVRIVKNSISYN